MLKFSGIIILLLIKRIIRIINIILILSLYDFWFCFIGCEGLIVNLKGSINFVVFLYLYFVIR